MRFLGIDPGRTAGWVCLEVDNSNVLTFEREQDIIAGRSTLRYVDRGTISVRKRKGFDSVDSMDLDYFGQWEDLLDRMHPDFVVIEQPVDAKEVWKGKRGGRPSSTGTMFRAGCYYAYIFAAVATSENPEWKSYEVKEWMQGRPRKTTDLLIQNAWRNQINHPNDTDNLDLWKDHELMALGVLLWHLGRLIPTEAR